MRPSIISMLAAFAMMSVNSHAQSNESDSVSNDTPKTEQAAAYPIVQSISADAAAEKDIQMMRFESLLEDVEKKITQAKRKKTSTAELEQLVEICNNGMDGLEGIDRVIIVDSIVVDKQSFLSAYPISEDLGKLTLSANGETVQYQAQLNGMALIATREKDSGIKIMQKYLDDKDDKGAYIKGLEVSGDINYPFLMPDGQRFYFAARSKDGYGNYDLYATRYDSDAKRFYKAENMGFPYNSYANDYMLVIDEDNRLGWFASDRYQPQNKVCIYTFIPNESRHTIDTTDMSEKAQTLFATLHSLTELEKEYSEEENTARASAKHRHMLIEKTANPLISGYGHFVVSDTKTCSSASDFKSPQAREMYKDWLNKSKNIKTLRQQLDDLRAGDTSKQKAKILNLEARILELKSEINELAKQIRKAEIEK